MTLKDYERNASRCIRCSLCKWIPQLQIKSHAFASICPSIERYNFHAYSGGGKMIVAHALLNNRLEYTDELLNVIYRCSACGGCSVSCGYMFDLEPQEVIIELRNKLVEDGFGPMPKHRKWPDYIREKHNPYNEDHEKRIAWMPENIELDENSDLVYFVGCTTSYRRTEIAKATVRILNDLGVKFKILHPNEYCCGSPLLKTGQKKEALELMKQNVEIFKKAKVKKILTSCAGCYHMFKVEYPKILNTEFKVLHTAEFLDNLVKEDRLKFEKSVDLKVTYHDPCHLGRLGEPYIPWKGELVEVIPGVIMPVPPKPVRRGTNGIYEAPRNVLKNIPGIKLVEMERIKEYAWCCGAGGGVKAAFPDFALWTASKRIEEAKTTGAEAIVSCCPFCSTNLKDAIRETGEKMQFYDLTELVARALGG